VTLAELMAGVIVVALNAYVLFGGADFGGGVWDLLARGPQRARQRELVAHAIGPVWEANHVWLIFVIVIIFSGFPAAFEALSIALFVPFHLVLLGIILRGASFVFRAYSPQSAHGPATTPAMRAWGVVFGIASVITPVLLGMSLGAVSSGAIRVSGDAVTIAGPTPWLTPVALLMGALALALCAYLAAVFLANEADDALREDFRTRALLAGTAVVALSVIALPLVYRETRHLWDGLVGGPATAVFGPGIIAALLSGCLPRQRDA
jgi:cytochrome d ubiquinol oxidase subunit II